MCLGLVHHVQLQKLKKLTLSSLHPDAKPGDRTQHKKFVELNNAYSTLINAEAREAYDQNFGSRASGQNFSSHRHHETYHNPFHADQMREKTYWFHRQSHGNFHEAPTSTYSSSQRKPKKWIVTGCFILMMIGTVLYFSAYSFATNYNHKRIDAKSRRISAAYLKVKEEALGNGREKQLKKYHRRWGLETNMSEDK